MEKSNMTPYATPDPEFNGLLSSDEVWYAGETNIRLTDVIDEKADINHTHTGYAAADHVHNSYAVVSDIESLQSSINNKADVSHSHANYASQSDLELLEDVVDTKANTNHTHTEYSPINHSHNDYASTSHTHTASEIGAAVSGHNHDDDYSDINHNHNSAYATVGHNHGNDYASIDHSHDNVYYTEAEVDSLLDNKSNLNHNHNSSYDALGAANTALASAKEYAKEYTDDVIANEVTARNSAISTAKSSAISTASSDATTKANNALASAKSYTDNAVATAKNDLLNGAGNAYDTLKELGDLIDENVDAIEALETVAAGKANASHTHTIANITNLQSTLDGKAAASHGTHVSYSTTAPVMDGSASVGTASTVARSDHKHPTDTSRAAQSSLDSHTSNKSNPHGVTLAQLGVTSTAAELNALDGITATVTELNYVDGVTSNIQTQLNGKAASGHTHNYAGSSSAGGAATSANKLATARTISLTGDVTGSTSFDGSGNVSITATVADDSHNHTIANVDGLQTALDGKSATSHTHSAEALIQMANALFGTNSAGGVEYSYGSGSGKNVLTEISNMPQGLHTMYSIAGTTGNPETSESYRYFIHKTSTTIGWIWAFGADGSIYSNYLAGANTFKGWKTIHDAKRKPLWTGSYYMTAGHTATPSKKLSECEHGWMLLWSDYDPDTSTVNNTDFCTTMIPNRNWAGGTWNGAAYYCDVPRYTAGTATDSESRIIKVLNVYDNKLVGTANNNAAPRNDVILRAVYEF